jgi:hypothetical protein
MQESVNLRNNLSHGFLDDRSIGTSAMYFWWLCLRICILLVPIRAPVQERGVGDDAGGGDDIERSEK